MASGNFKEQKKIGSINLPINLNSVKDTLNLTWKDIGKQTGLTGQTIGKIASGKCIPTEKWVDDFCNQFHVDREWLITGEGKPVFVKEIGKESEDVGVGMRLKQMREELGLKQKDVYEILGVTYSFYSRMENGRAGLTLQKAKALEDSFGIGADWILHGDEGKKRYPLSDRMIDFLWRNEEVRRKLWEMLMAETEGRIFP